MIDGDIRKGIEGKLMMLRQKQRAIQEVYADYRGVLCSEYSRKLCTIKSYIESMEWVLGDRDELDVD